MTRIFLGGKGDPIPELAMPDISLAVDLPPLPVPVLESGDFIPADYIAMGYTHYEVTCVGGAGGRGSDGVTYSGGVSWPYYITGGVKHWHDPFLVPSETYKAIVFGGGGGGGGSQKVSGRLDELPTTVPVVVGAAGDHAGISYIAQATDLTPTPPSAPGDVYDLPHPTFPAAHNGSDGGPSTFGDTICMASGGKGGGPCVSATIATEEGMDTSSPFSGYGGEGGLGGRTTAGGGAAGSSSTSFASPANGSDGTWTDNIGSGGGGGRGGVFRDGYDPAFQNPVPGQPPILRRFASSGGQGAVSFTEPGMLGPREPRSNGTYTTYSSDPTTGLMTPITRSNNTLTKPGTGGGARVTPSTVYGSRGAGAVPQGVVFIRLLKIV